MAEKAFTHRAVAGLLARLYERWSFDDGQVHTHTWHDREDFIAEEMKRFSLSREDLRQFLVEPMDEPKPRPNMIVAEFTKNWRVGDPAGPKILSQLFELGIAINERRGYNLHSWKMTSVFAVHDSTSPNNSITETIVAVFVRNNSQP